MLRGVRAARGWPHLCTRRCSTTDRALSAALSNVLGSLRKLDPACVPLPSSETGAADVPGVRASGPKMLLRFTCTASQCEGDDAARTMTKVISKRSYEEGTCPGAQGVCGFGSHC